MRARICMESDSCARGDCRRDTPRGVQAAAPARLIVTPTQGHAGDAVFLSGSGFAARPSRLDLSPMRLAVHNSRGNKSSKQVWDASLERRSAFRGARRWESA